MTDGGRFKEHQELHLYYLTKNVCIQKSVFCLLKIIEPMILMDLEQILIISCFYIVLHGSFYRVFFTISMIINSFTIVFFLIGAIKDHLKILKNTSQFKEILNTIKIAREKTKLSFILGNKLKVLLLFDKYI